MSNWIDSGGEKPRLYGVRPTICETRQRRIGGAARWRAVASLACVQALIALAAPVGHARDRGQFVNTNAELKAWFDGLRSGKGLVAPMPTARRSQTPTGTARTGTIGSASRAMAT